MNNFFSRNIIIFSIFISIQTFIFSADKFLIKIQVGEKSFNATLLNNPSAKAIVDKLPMTIVMNDLYNNEKYHLFPDEFPTKLERVRNIETGDIFLYSSNYLVIFYENFETGYSYTRLGKIEEPSGLKEALGSGSVRVTWSLSP